MIAPSVLALQVLLGYGDSFDQDNDVKYNTKKTVCMLVRPKEFKSDFVPCFELAGFKLKCVSTNKYLGVHIATDQKDDRSIRQQCRNIYSRDNTIIRNFKHCSDEANVNCLSPSALVFTAPHYGLPTPSKAFVT